MCVHSFKGGTGKTSLAVNISAILASKGYNVTLLDFDFSGPSLHTIFKASPEYYLNDFIIDKCSIDDFLVNCTEDFIPGCKGSLSIGYANPETEAIRFMIGQGRKWQMKAISRIMSLKRELHKERKKDFLILDTSPGVHYSSVNAIVASDKVLLVVKLDNSDFEGTLTMLRGIHAELDRETMLVMNKVPYTTAEVEIHTSISQGTKEDHLNLLKQTFAEVSKRKFFRILGVIPCYCSVTLGRGVEVLAFSDPDHLFIKAIELTILPNLSPEE
ncbi:MAG: MinD/ParA family ATP-binding protein [Candidatus Hodarchaeales archaeon]